MSKNSKDPRIAIIITMILIAIFILYRYFSQTNEITLPPQDVKVVEAEKIQLQNISQTIRLIGTINAKNSSMLIAQDSGTLRIIFDSGSKVKKGETIAKLENSELEKNYELLKKAKDIATEQYKRADSLYNSGSYSKAEFDIIKNNLITAEKNLHDSKIALDKLTFYAPFDGIVGYYKIKSGEHAQLGQKVVNFYDPEFLRVDFDIPSSVVKKLNDGQKVKINDESYKISIIQKILDEDKHMVPVYVEIDNQDHVIGSNVYVELSIIDKQQVIVIPFEAVFLQQETSSVYIIKDNTLELRPVKLGIREKDLVEIESGLEIGEEIVSCATSRLYPGVQVKIHKAE